VDRIEILESGHPELERLRSADGKLYFYDLGGTRHPSFSVGGALVHNSSILKSFTGKTRNAIIAAFAKTPYRLACTATPAPNDFTELGNHAEFLGVKSRVEMLAEYFVHDGGDTSSWRLKGHAEEEFWRWVCTWAACLKSPADLGFDATAFELPALEMHEHVIEVDHVAAWSQGTLFAMDARTLSDQRAVRRATMGNRAELAAELAAGDDPVLIWCELNAEADEVERAISGSIQVRGSDSPQNKVAAVEWFLGQRCMCGQLKKSGPISGIITETTSTSGSRVLESNEIATTPGVEINMPPTLSSETRPDELQRSGPSKTLTNTSRSGSKATTELISLSTRDCLGSRAEDAPSAAPQSALIRTPGAANAAGSMLTTATFPVAFADCSAPTATKGSDSSRTASSDSSGRRCICGQVSNRRVLITKASMFGHGLNLQVCSRMIFLGASHSYEQTYQAVRRCWRFGQTRPVHVHVLRAETEGAIVANFRRKEADAERLAQSMVSRMRDAMREEIGSATRETNAYAPSMSMTLPSWMGA
jgi:hypothetical protein